MAVSKYHPAERMHQLLEHDVDIPTRSIWFWDDVAEYSIADVVKKIKYFESTEPEGDITIYISTHGGMETEMFALYDTIRSSSCTVTTIGIGKVMSAGPLILAAGDVRQIYPSTQIMIHEGWEEWAPSGLAEVKTQTKYFEHCHDLWCALMGERTKKDKNYWFKITDHEPDRFFTAKQALALGLVDEIIGVE
jgi:ATP-dependent Clp protease protease subunit